MSWMSRDGSPGYQPGMGIGRSYQMRGPADVAIHETTLELCKSNSIGGRFVPATVVETWTIPAAELADELRAAEQRLRPGWFVREQRDTTGN